MPKVELKIMFVLALVFMLAFVFVLALVLSLVQLGFMFYAAPLEFSCVVLMFSMLENLLAEIFRSFEPQITASTEISRHRVTPRCSIAKFFGVLHKFIDYTAIICVGIDRTNILLWFATLKETS
jgi:hypothetical protein